MPTLKSMLNMKRGTPSSVFTGIRMTVSPSSYQMPNGRADQERAAGQCVDAARVRAVRSGTPQVVFGEDDRVADVAAADLAAEGQVERARAQR